MQPYDRIQKFVIEQQNEKPVKSILETKYLGREVEVSDVHNLVNKNLKLIAQEAFIPQINPIPFLMLSDTEKNDMLNFHPIQFNVDQFDQVLIKDEQNDD